MRPAKPSPGVRSQPGGIRNDPGGIRSIGQFGSPSQNPKAFQNAMGSHFDSLRNQLFGSTPQGNKQGTWKEKPGVKPAPEAPVGAAASGMGGPQEFGTYAAPINPDQYGSENFARQGIKGVSKLDGIGGIAGALGSFGGMGGMGGSMGGSFGGPQAFVDLLMSLMGQMNEEGPIRGR